MLVIQVNQSDDAKQVAHKVVSALQGEEETVEITNAGEYTQKSIAVAELAKRNLAEEKITVHQYNKLEIANEVYTEPSAVSLDEPKLKYRVPRLLIRLSVQSQSFGSGWTSQ